MFDIRFVDPIAHSPGRYPFNYPAQIGKTDSEVLEPISLSLSFQTKRRPTTLYTKHSPGELILSHPFVNSHRVAIVLGLVRSKPNTNAADDGYDEENDVDSGDDLGARQPVERVSR